MPALLAIFFAALVLISSSASAETFMWNCVHHLDSQADTTSVRACFESVERCSAYAADEGAACMMQPVAWCIDHASPATGVLTRSCARTVRECLLQSVPQELRSSDCYPAGMHLSSPRERVDYMAKEVFNWVDNAKIICRLAKRQYSDEYVSSLLSQAATWYEQGEMHTRQAALAKRKGRTEQLHRLLRQARGDYRAAFGELLRLLRFVHHTGVSCL